MNNPETVAFIRWIVLLPLAGASVNFIAGATLQKRIGKTAIGIIGCSVVVLAFALATGSFAAMLARPPAQRFLLDTLWHWFDVGGLNLDVALWLDPLSMVMVLIVTGVGGLIHIY